MRKASLRLHVVHVGCRLHYPSLLMYDSKYFSKHDEHWVSRRVVVLCRGERSTDAYNKRVVRGLRSRAEKLCSPHYQTPPTPATYIYIMERRKVNISLPMSPRREGAVFGKRVSMSRHLMHASCRATSTANGLDLDPVHRCWDESGQNHAPAF